MLRMYSVVMLLHLLRPAIILARQNLSPTMVVVGDNDDRATDTLPASHFPTFPTSQIQLPHACALPCHQTRQSPHANACFFSLTPHPSPTQEPRSALAYRELVRFREPFSTHVKLQPMPKSILMASCCAEEMLIATSPPFLDYLFISPLAPPPRLFREFDGEGGLDGRRT
jgi:hypothetical protein